MKESIKSTEGFVESKNVSPNWVTENFLDFMDLEIEECKGKNIASIGGGFGIFEVDAAKNGGCVTIIDPLFRDMDKIQGKIDDTIKWLNKRNRKGVKQLMKNRQKELESALQMSEYDKPENEDNLNFINQQIDASQEYERRKIVLASHLTKWKEKVQQYGVVLNPSAGGKIEGICDNSQDIVMINHTLNHIINKNEQWQQLLKDIFKEVDRIIKDDGKFWIIDYVGDVKDLEAWIKSYKGKYEYKRINGSFSYCLDASDIKEFINQYFYKK